MLQNLSDLDFETSMSLKVKCESVFGLPIYAFLLMFINNIWPNSATLWDKGFQNLSGLDINL